MAGRSSPPAADDDAADELYALPPQEFTARRDALVAQAKGRGDGSAAKRIASLRKPSTSAWLANQLSRIRPDDVRSLLDLGAALRKAQAGLRGDELRELSRQRRAAVNALVREARRIAVSLGRPVNEGVGRELEQTLEAALADDESARLLESGRLVSALTPSGGFDSATPQLRIVRDKAEPKTSGRRKAAVPDAVGAATAAQIDDARDRATDAEATARAAQKALAAQASEHDRLVGEVSHYETAGTDVQSQMEELAKRLGELKRQVVDVRREEQRARRAVTTAQRAARTAENRSAAARAELKALMVK